MSRLSLLGIATLALGGLLAAPAQVQAQIQVEAISGEPFGVGRMTVTVPRAVDRELADDGYLLVERDGRALYSVLVDKPVQRLLRGLFNQGRPIIQRPEQITVYFLFQGDAPLDLSFYTPDMYRATITPRSEPALHERLLFQWWREYTNRVKTLYQENEYPTIVENYVTPTLARRLDLPLPHLFWIERPGQVRDSLQLLAGTEELEAKLQRQTLLKLPGEQQAANLPLPAPLPAPAVDAAEAGPDSAVESIALRVPAESLYVRFGNFANYLWLSDFMRAWGGDLQNMIQVRSLNYDLLGRREQQLAIRQSSMAQVLGPAVISDVAFVGYDTFMREGPAFGILFQARNGLLANDIIAQREAALKSNPAARMETVKIAGRDVSFLHTPDNSVRSFYAVQGSYHLVCTSRELTRRFLEICEARGEGSLGRTAEFRQARRRMPLDRNDTVFVYLSEPFQRQLIDPHSRIEMTRRTQARIDLQLWRLARLAAQAEGEAAQSIDELIAAGLLPRGFAERPDGSRPVEVEGRMLDSLRGDPRAFLPVADVEVKGVTPAEAEEYQKFADYFRSEWGRMDPVAAAIRREDLNGKGLQRLNIELVVSPYIREHFGALGKWLGAPTKKAVPPVPGNIATFNLVMGKALGAASADAPDYLLFGGLREFQLPLARVGDKIRLMFVPRPLEYVQGYLGAWPHPGVLSLLTGLPGGGAGPDPEGYMPILQGIAWQRQWGDFTALSMKQDVLAQVTPQLQVVELPDPAQLRMEIVDPTQTGSVETLNGLAFMRAREATVSNSRLMNRLSDQLRVPRAEAQQAAEQLLGARLASALGGEYQLVQFPSGLRVWKSTALEPVNQFALTEVPDAYAFPLLKWFRGADARVLLTDDELTGVIHIDMQGEPAARPTFQLPALPTLPSIPGLGGK